MPYVDDFDWIEGERYKAKLEKRVAELEAQKVTIRNKALEEVAKIVLELIKSEHEDIAYAEANLSDESVGQGDVRQNQITHIERGYAREQALQAVGMKIQALIKGK